MSATNVVPTSVAPHQTHDAPLLHLVHTRLHGGTTLADRVRKLRYKRRKGRGAGVVPVEPVEQQVEEVQDVL